MWEHSEIMKEFAKIAENEDLLGLKKVAKKSEKDEEQTIREKQLPAPEKSIVEVAHPTPAYIAESQGDGALVENQQEQHDKIMEVINKMPTGSLVHRYAQMVDELVKMANECEEAGDIQAAELLDATAALFVKEMETLPFE